MSTPGPQQQIEFLLRIQRLLAEGSFTATYKYALWMALADLAVEVGDDSCEPLTITVDEIADKFVTYYWRPVVEYVPKGGPGIILRQNTDRQAAIVRHVAEARTARPTLWTYERGSCDPDSTSLRPAGRSVPAQFPLALAAAECQRCPA